MITSRMSRRIAWIAIFGLATVWLYFHSGSFPPPAITFFAVGQGDSALFQAGETTVLIDGGPDRSVLRHLGETLAYGERQIDLIVVSHFHDDHITGLIGVLERYEVDEMVYYQSIENELAAELWAAARRRHVNVRPITERAVMDLGANCKLSLLPPPPGVPIDENNSLAALFNCPGLSALLTGDNSAAVEKALLESGVDLSAAILKAGHHGSKTANSVAFLEAVSPEELVVSCGRDNSYGHPHSEVLKRSAALGLRVWRTDSGSDLTFRARPHF